MTRSLKAKSGGGPTFIECLTYRLHDHTTSDDASRYRKKKRSRDGRLKSL